MLEDNRIGAGCVQNAPKARTSVTPARQWHPCWLLTAFCLLALTLSVRAQEGGAPPAPPSSEGTNGVMERIKEKWLLFSFLGGLLVVSSASFIILSRKKPASLPTVDLAGAVSPPGESPWARSSANQPAPLANGAENGQPAWNPSAVIPTVSPDVSSQQVAAAQYASLYTPQTPVSQPAVAPSSVFPQADPMMPATARAVVEPPAPNIPVVPLGYPLSTPANRAQVDFLTNHEAATRPASDIVESESATTAEQTIYVTADSDRTIDEASPTLTVLPGYFEIVASNDPVKDPIGTRKKLYALNSNPDFGIARPGNDQEQIANFIPLHSKRVSRTVEKQGKVVYDFQQGTYTVINFADPTHSDPARRCNPIRVEGRPLMPNEGVTIRDGDRIQVGDIMLRFHIEGRASTVGVPKSDSKKSPNGVHHSA